MKQFEKCSAGPDETVSFFTIGIDETVSLGPNLKVKQFH